MENDAVPNLPDVSKVSTLGIFAIIEIVEKHRFLQNLWKHLQKTCIYTFMNTSMVERPDNCSKTYFIMYQYQADWCHSSPVSKQGQTWFLSLRSALHHNTVRCIELISNGMCVAALLCWESDWYLNAIISRFSSKPLIQLQMSSGRDTELFPRFVM